MGKQYRDQAFLVKLGRRIVALREERSITQERLQEMSGLDARQIGRIERAETNASISSIKLIAEQLKLPISDLLDSLD